ncbi:non-ribosomal peptide synthetase, partial [Tenacibaculum xiamenense]|uniref:non-ribosomal peptide synthetase n=1 Tax=Tenacibaculum xiamenense TaxID=1261553 RepID=UPI0038B4684F
MEFTGATEFVNKLHSAQQEVYLGQLMNPKSSLYNIGGYVIFKGDLDLCNLRKIINKLPLVFDTYNFEYDLTGGEPCFYLDKDNFKCINLEELDFSLQERSKEKAKKWMYDKLNTSFDLSKDQLYHYTIIKISEDEYWWFGYVHHLVFDGYGFAIKVNYVVNEYDRLKRGEIVASKSYPSYINSIIKNQNYLESSQYVKDATYWKKKYNLIPNSILSRGENKNLKADRLTITVPESLKESLNRLTKNTRSNIPQITIAALLIYYGKINTQEFFSFGVPVHNRGSRNERETLGMFSGILPFKVKYIPNQVLLDLITEIRSELLKDYRHRQYPISHLNRSLNLLSLNREQVFDLVVNYERFPFPKSLHNLEIEIKNLASTSDFPVPLSFRWCDYGENSPMELHVDYKEGYFEKGEVNDLVNRLFFVLEQFESSLNNPVNSLSILFKSEKHILLEEFNSTKVPYPKGKTLVDLFSAQVLETPDSIAVVYSGESLSYLELDKRSNQLAHYLLEQGVKPDDLIGICLGQGLEMIIGILGIIKSGGAFVPIDPDYPQDRINYILEDTGVKLLITSGEEVLIEKEFLNITLIRLDIEEKLVSSYPSSSLDVVLSPSNLAYVIYTSGSTGSPKGVMIEHLNLLNFLISVQKNLNINELRSLLSLSNFTFDIFYLEIFVPLITGARVILIEKELRRSGNALKLFIDESEPDLIQGTPSTWKMLIDSGWKNRSRSIIISGGETIKESLKNKLTSLNDSAIWNLYGPTEATIWTTFNKMSLSNKVSIGSPIGNTETYITDSELNLQPIGVAGELCIGGLGVARGYLNRPELTKERFVPNPFKEGGRIYKTGDLARWLSDGTIEFIGRKDNQVKIRGHRIELGEIENVLSDFSKVVQCCIVAKEDDLGNKYLVGYVVLSEDLDREALN